MLGKRFLALALAGLMVATSVNTGSIKAYAQETPQEPIEASVGSEEESALPEENVEIDENAGGDQLETLPAEPEISQAPEEGFGSGDEFFFDEESQEELAVDSVKGDTADAETNDGSQAEDSDVDITLTLNANGGLFENEEDTLILNAKANKALEMDIDAPVKEGFLFTGWFLDEELTNTVDLASYIFTENAVLYAGWQEIATEEGSSKLMGDGDTVTVTYVFRDDSGKPGASTGYWYNYDAGSSESGRTYEYTVEVPKEQAIGDNYPNEYWIRNDDQHFSFSGWYEDKQRTKMVSDLKSIAPEANTVFYAGYISDRYVITYHAGEDTAYFYYQDGWFTDPGYYDKYYKGYSKEVLNPSIQAGSLYNNNPKRNIVGWNYADGTQALDSPSGYITLTKAQDIDIYAVWEDNASVKVVTFNLNAPSGTKACFYDGSMGESSEPKQFAIDAGSEQYFGIGTIRIDNLHYELLGFSTNQKAPTPDPEWTIEDDTGSIGEFYVYFENTLSYTADTVLYAVWKKIDSHIVTFDTTSAGYFYKDGYGNVETKRYYATDSSGRLHSGPSEPIAVDDDKAFKAWLNGTTEVNIWDKIFTKDTTLKAGYTSAVIVTLDSMGGTIYDHDTGDSVEILVKKVASGKYFYSYDYEPYFEGKTFAGWYKEPSYVTKVDIYNYKPTKDETLYAKWIGSFDVTFDYGSGTVSDPSSYILQVRDDDTVVSANNNNSLPKDPVAPDTTKAFAGWYKDAALTQPISKSEIERYVVKEDTTFYAKYDEAYTVTFVAEHGFKSKPGTSYQIQVSKNDTLKGKYPTAASNKRTVFSGWYVGDEVVKDIYNYKVTGDVTFTAKYTECYILTFHANQEGALLDGASSTVEVSVNKGTAYRFSSSESEKDELFYAPELDFSSVTTQKVPLLYPSSNGDKTVGWATNQEGTGRVYYFSSSSHRYVDEDGSSRGYSMYGFVPTKDMDFYVKWNDAVNIIYTSNEFKFRDDSQYDVYGELSGDLKTRTLKVPKGITFANVSAPSINAYDRSGVSSFSYRWTLDPGGKNNISNNTVVDKDTYVYLYVYNKKTGGSSSNYKTVTFHSGEGYFDSPGNDTENRTYYPSSTTRISSPIPTINENGKAFSGWYTDKELTKRYTDKYQISLQGYWVVIMPSYVSDLYAGYSETYEVTLDANGGYFDTDSGRIKDPDETLRDRVTYVVKADPVGTGIKISDYTKKIRRDGDKVFAGWYTSPTGGEKAETYSDGSNHEFFKSPTGTDCTLYAKWVDYVLPEGDKITLNTTEQTIRVGEKFKLVAKVTGDIAETQDVHWYCDGYWTASGNTYGLAPATISSDGTVEGLYAGGIYVYAEVNGVRSDDAKITVSATAVKDSISIPEEYKNLDLIKNDAVTVVANVTPYSKANQVKWTSANSAIASVEGAGDSAVITAGGQEGETTITAALGTAKATIKVKVSVPIKLDKNEFSLTAGGASVELKAIISGTELQNKDIIWTSTNEAVAKVIPANDSEHNTKVLIDPADDLDETADVTITATIDGTEYSDICEVHVNPMDKAANPYSDVIPGSGQAWPLAVKENTIVNLATATPGASIYYTDDGTVPGLDAAGEPIGTLYTDAFTITEDVTIKAFAYKKGLKASDVVTFAYTIKTDEWGEIAELDNAVLKTAILEKYENNSNKVPKGVWYIFRTGDDSYFITDETGVDSAIQRNYNGSKITFNEDVIVLHNTRFLIENRDYTLTFSNNTVVGDAASKKKPTVTIKGKGIYNSSAAFTFTIAKEVISEANITSEHVVTVVEGKTKLGNTKPALSFNGKKLTINKDYVLQYYKGEYPDHDNLVANPAKEVVNDSYFIEILAKEGGNFTGTHGEYIEVVPVPNAKNVVQVSKLKVGDAKGKSIAIDYPGLTEAEFKAKFDNSAGDENATFFVTSGKVKLKYNTDYTIEVIDDGQLQSAGKHSFVVIGIPKDEEAMTAGAIEYIGEKTCTYEVKGTALSKVKIAGLKTSVEYTGSPITLDDLFAEDKVTKAQNWEAVTLYTYNSKTKVYTKLNKMDGEGEGDYFVKIDNAGVLGKFTLEFVGINGYTGSVKKTITIKATNFKTAGNLDIDIADGTFTTTYVKSGAKPSVRVFLGGNELAQGIDYTVVYKNNAKIADKDAKGAPYVTIKGIGNYTGSSANKTFTITKADISQVEVVASDIAYKVGKAGYYFVTPKLMDGGKAITAGKNKDVETIKKTDYVYTYQVDTELEDGTKRAAGDIVKKTDKIPVGTTIVVAVPVECKEKSPYIKDVDYLIGCYRIIDSKKNISKCKVAVKDTSKSKLTVNNGEEIKLTKADFKVTLGSGKNLVTLNPEDYKIVSISNNTGVGTASVVIEGVGDYGGRKTITLKITAKSMK